MVQLTTKTTKQRQEKAMLDYQNAPNPTAYYQNAKPGVKRLIDRGLINAGLERVSPYKETTKFYGNHNQRDPNAPKNSKDKINTFGAHRGQIQFKNRSAQAYNFVITPKVELKTFTQVYVVIAKQQLPFFDPTKRYAIKCGLIFANGATSGFSLPTQRFQTKEAMKQAILDTLDMIYDPNNPHYNRKYGPIAQIDLEFIEM